VWLEWINEGKVVRDVIEKSGSMFP
jgi:hypothetical protein